MPTSQNVINTAIRDVADRGIVFTVEEVANHLDVEHTDGVLHERFNALCDTLIIPLPEINDGASASFLSIDAAKRWWLAQPLRWVESGFFDINDAALASSAAISFDDKLWCVIPRSFIDIGRRMGAIAPKVNADSYVSPWALILSHSTALPELFRDFVQRYVRELSPLSGSINRSAEIALTSLEPRDADVVRMRYGIDSQSMTLQTIADDLNLTRERVRQVQRQAEKQCQQPKIKQILFDGFATEFLAAGSSLVMKSEQMTAQARFVFSMLEIEVDEVKSLGLSSLYPRRVLGRLITQLSTNHARVRSILGEDITVGLESIQAMSSADLSLVRQHFDWQNPSVEFLKQNDLLYITLRKIGRAAHFTEIAERAKIEFPDRKTSARAWHGALDRVARDDSDSYGIVWTGRHGTYGLEEFGDFRPDGHYSVQVESIVERRFEQTRLPVPTSYVLDQMRKRRRGAKESSVNMALAYSNKLSGSAILGWSPVE